MVTRRGLIALLITGLASCATKGSADAVDAAVATDAITVDAMPPLSVLFVGNSYTYVLDLPAEIAAMASPMAPIVSTSSTVGSATLRIHWEGAARPVIEGGGHDVVVLQGQSVEPLWSPDFATYGDLLAGAATAANARVVFYGTWARRAGDVLYDDPITGGSPDAMQDRLTAAYVERAAHDQAGLARVGEARRLLIGEHPELDLFDPDGSHPSAAGVYLAAGVFVEVLTGYPPTDVERFGLDAPTRAILRDAAHRAVIAL